MKIYCDSGVLNVNARVCDHANLARMLQETPQSTDELNPARKGFLTHSNNSLQFPFLEADQPRRRCQFKTHDSFFYACAVDFKTLNRCAVEK